MTSGGNDGDGISRLIFHDVVDFTGGTKTFMDSITNAANVLGSGRRLNQLLSKESFCMNVFIFDYLADKYELTFLFYQGFQ